MNECISTLYLYKVKLVKWTIRRQIFLYLEMPVYGYILVIGLYNKISHLKQNYM